MKFLAAVAILALAACAPQPPAADATASAADAGAAVDLGAPPGVPVDEADQSPLKEQCDAETYRSLIGTPVADANLPPAGEFFRSYGVNDIITQEYRPRRTNVVYGTDGKITQVYCG